MWFKTKTSLIQIEGPVEITLGRFVESRTRKRGLGIYAYRYIHPEGTFQLLWSKPFQLKNRAIYLAYFPDSELGELEAADCMVHIEKALKSNENFCDVSGYGSVEDWSSGWSAFVRWPTEPEAE